MQHATTALGLCAFLALGVVLVLVGANQAELARALEMDLARSGLLGAALALGAGIGVTGAGPLVDRFPRRPLFMASVLVAALALLSIHDGVSFTRAFAHVFVLGAGVGFYDTLLNAVAIQQSEGDASRRLALLHSGATAGAVLGPPLVGALAAHGGWAASFHVTGIVLLAIAVGSAFVTLPDPVRAPTGLPGAAAPAKRSLASLTLLLLSVVGFSYVGAETALTVFAVPWAAHAGRHPATGQLAISALWLGLFAGRVGMLFLRRPLGASFLVGSGGIGAVLLLAAVASTDARIEIAMLAIGVALGAVYPVMIALAGARFPDASGTAAGLVAGAGAFGGFVVPWASGAIGDRAGLAIALASIAIVIALIGLCAVGLRMHERRRED